MMTNKNKIIIAIDGPAGAGKSTVAKKLAKALKYVYIDTGAMYRAITYKILKNNIDLNNEFQLKTLLQNTVLTYENENLCLDGLKLGKEIRSNEINANVSRVSSNGLVRELMTGFQREIGQKQSCILDGRDIGTAVFPNADIKIFLIADSKMRAQRRYDENLQKGIESSLEDIEKNIVERDKLDSTRKIAPLLKADDAVEIDTSNITVDEVIENIMKIYLEKTNV
ncbi:MAG: (d)CMP kinase [Proteocatella sp.]